MAAALETVVELFRSHDWGFELDEEKGLLRSSIDGDNGEWKVLVSAAEEDQVCLMLSILPQKCPENRRNACAELLARINYALLVGCFEMDFKTGRINFKTSYPFQAQLNSELLNRIIMFNINFMDKFMPAIMAVIYGGTPPAKALAALEKTNRKPSRRGSKSPNARRRFLNN